MNYRSVVVLGTATAVDGAEEKLAALEAFTEKLLPGRWAEARRPIAEGAQGDVGAARSRSTRRPRRSGTAGLTTATRPTPSSTSGPATSRSWSGRSRPYPIRRSDPASRCPPCTRGAIAGRACVDVGPPRLSSDGAAGIRHRRDEVRRLVGRRPGEGAARRAPVRRREAPRAARRRHRVRDGQDDRLADRARERGLAHPGPARARHAPLDGRADRLRARRDGDPRPRRGGRLATRARRRASSPTRRTPGRRSARSAATASGRALEEGKIVLVAGFQGFSRDTMEITTLGRGRHRRHRRRARGGARRCLRDLLRRRRRVHGRPADRAGGAQAARSSRTRRCSRWPPRARRCSMLRSVELARNHGVRIHARSTFSDEEGTWVQDGEGMEQPIVSAVTHSETDVVFTLTGHPRPAGRRGDDLRRRRRGARQRRHDHPERRPRAGGDVVLGAGRGRSRRRARRSRRRRTSSAPTTSRRTRGWARCR